MSLLTIRGQHRYWYCQMTSIEVLTVSVQGLKASLLVVMTVHVCIQCSQCNCEKIDLLATNLHQMCTD